MRGTDNSHLGLKVRLRINHLPRGPIKVFDAYGGFGVVWGEVIKKTGRKNIQRIGVDKEHRQGSVRGDNRKWMMGVDLSVFDVVDLDAYGIPFDQVKILFDAKYKGSVFFTFIQSELGVLPARLCEACGITREMRKIVPTVFGQIGWSLWLDWLGMNGVEKLYHESVARKHYGFFVLT